MRKHLVIIVLTMFSAVAEAKTPYSGTAGVPGVGGIFQVLKVTGEVRVWRRFGANWDIVVKGENLVAGELVQFPANSELKLKGILSGAGERVPRGFVIRTEDPLVTRIEDASLRALDFGGYFLSIEGVVKEEPAVEIPLISSAWRRAMSVLDDDRSKPEEAQVQTASRIGDASKDPVRDDFSEILIEHPRNGDTYFVEAFPTEMAVSWKAMPKGVKSVKVYLWRAEHGTPSAAIGQTDQTYFRVPVLAGGRYYVKIESPDGRWRSKTHLVIILTVDQIAGSANDGKKTAEQAFTLPSPKPKPSPKPPH